MRTFRIIIWALAFVPVCASGQHVYDSFEGDKSVYYLVMRGAVMDSAAPNPSADSSNNSAHCGRYVRSHQKYDNLRMSITGSLSNLPEFTSYTATRRFRIRVYTDAPPGTMIELQLASPDIHTYPEGIHSQFQAVTRTTKRWETLEFVFAVAPRGSKTTGTEVRAINLLFAPATHQPYTFYFDDLEGPAIVPVPKHKFSFKKRT